MTIYNQTAKVTWFDDRKGYGFVQTQSHEAVFCHYTAIEDGFKTLTEGQDIVIDVVEGPKGPQAVNVRKVLCD